MKSSNTVVRLVTPADLDRCFAIESIAYEGDEAATREKIATRIATWPQGFIVAEVDGVVAGFINSGAAYQVEMADEAFKELIGHDPDGPHVVIMSVVVHPIIKAGLGETFDERIHRAHARNAQGEHQPDVQGAAYCVLCQLRLRLPQGFSF